MSAGDLNLLDEDQQSTERPRGQHAEEPCFWQPSSDAPAGVGLQQRWHASHNPDQLLLPSSPIVPLQTSPNSAVLRPQAYDENGQGACPLDSSHFSSNSSLHSGQGAYHRIHHAQGGLELLQRLPQVTGNEEIWTSHSLAEPSCSLNCSMQNSAYTKIQLSRLQDQTEDSLAPLAAQFASPCNAQRRRA